MNTIILISAGLFLAAMAACLPFILRSVKGEEEPVLPRHSKGKLPVKETVKLSNGRNLKILML